MPIAKFIARLGLVAAVTCAALIGLTRPLGWTLADGDFITYEDRGSNGQSQLYVIDLQRDVTASLTEGRISNASRPATSPDGRQIAFVSLIEPDQSAAGEVYVVDLLTNDMRRLTLQTASSFVQYLWWSPNGQELALVGLLDDTWGLFVADMDSGEMRRISDVEGTKVVWSPDGRRIGLSVPTDDGYGLYDILADGSDLRLLNEGYAWIGAQAWSPDGRRLVFSAFDGIYVVTMGADGITQQHISATGYLPAWSPDGTRIAFVESDTSASLYTMNPDGSDLQKVLEGGSDWYIYDLAWSPDSRRLALESECNIGGDEFVLDLCLHVVNADGSDARRIPIQTDPTFAGRFVWWP